MKEKIKPFPSTDNLFGTEAYEHLEPIVKTLIAAGNSPTHASVFYKDKDGWVCDLQKPIDFGLLRETFEFPDSILVSEEDDSIFCQNTWIEIKGNSK